MLQFLKRHVMTNRKWRLQSLQLIRSVAACQFRSEARHKPSRVFPPISSSEEAESLSRQHLPLRLLSGGWITSRSRNWSVRPRGTQGCPHHLAATCCNIVPHDAQVATQRCLDGTPSHWGSWWWKACAPHHHANSYDETPNTLLKSPSAQNAQKHV